MVKKTIKAIYHKIRDSWQLISYYIKYIKNFYIPNFRNIFHHKISLNGHCNFNQTTLFQGLGNVKIGHNCNFGYWLGGFFRYGTIEIQARYRESIILLGNNIFTNNNVFILAANYIEVGNETLIGQNVVIMDHEAHGINPSKRGTIGQIGEVIIGKNVWIGNNVTILKNSFIGANSIVATGAVVTGYFPENVIIGGVPAKVIKNIE